MLNKQPPKDVLKVQVDYPALAQEILRHLRKDLSQRDLSERLGYSFNQVGKWEIGATQIKFSDFIKIAQALEIPIEKHIRESFWALTGEFTVPNILRAMEVNLNLSSVQFKEYQKSLQKWSAGAIEPDFAQVLMLMGIHSVTLISWLSRFIDCSQIEKLKDPFEEYLRRLEILLVNPHVVFVTAAIKTDVYKNLKAHNEELLAEHAACTVDELRAALQLLASEEIITFKNEKYELTSPDFNFGNIRSPKLRGFSKCALKLAAERYPNADSKLDPSKTYTPAMGSVHVVPLSAEAALKVSNLITQLNRTISDIVKEDQGLKTNVQVVVMQSFPSNIYS